MEFRLFARSCLPMNPFSRLFAHWPCSGLSGLGLSGLKPCNSLPAMLLPAVLLLVTVLVTGCDRFKKPAPVEFKTEASVRTNMVQSVSANGGIAPIRQVQVGSQISGTITEMKVDFNSVVKEGDVLARIDPATYERSLARVKADLANASAGLAMAEFNSKRAKQLFTAKLISETESQQADVSLLQAQAGVKTREAAVESAQVDLDRTTIFAPIGGGGLLTAIFRGLPNPTSLTGHANRAIRIHGVQPSGNDTVVGPLRAGKDTARTLGAGEAHTAISGLGVPIDLDATRALHAIRSTGGDGHLVADTSVWDAQAMLARHEGLFIEPAGSTSVAGLIDAARAGQIGADDHVICVLTGHGFKDGPASIRLANHHPLDPAILDATDLTGEYFARILN